jgi:O-antigen/teichoic acid export membrane protein
MPTALISSFIPRFYQINNLKKNEDYISLLVTMILLVCTTISVAIWLISPYLIDILYGAKYRDAVSIVPIILASTTLGMCGSAVYHILIKTKGYSFIMKKMVASAILSVPLTWFMTIHYGIEGAVMSLLLIEILNLTVFNFMYKKTKVARILLNSLSPAQIKNLKNI